MDRNRTEDIFNEGLRTLDETIANKCNKTREYGMKIQNILKG